MILCLKTVQRYEKYLIYANLFAKFKQNGRKNATEVQNNRSDGGKNAAKRDDVKGDLLCKEVVHG